MPWTPPASPITWQDFPDLSTSVSAAHLNQAEGYASTVGQSVVDYVAQVEARTVPYTVYLDQLNGNDANKGNSVGLPFLTLAKAVATLQQAGHGGKIAVLTTGPAGNINVAAPISFVQPIYIECLTLTASTFLRTFDTPNGRSVWDAVVTAGGSTAVSATATFTNADNGRIVAIYGAGVGGGRYYDFINGNPPSGTTANLTATTTVARSASTDPKGVKMSVVGDWNRVVTDAGMTAGGSVVTSATAAWTLADIGTEIVVGGAGQGGQALRSAIVSVSGSTATIMAIATNTVTNKRCAIGVNFGDLFTWHYGQGGIKDAVLQDNSSGANRIGAAIKICPDDQGASGTPLSTEVRFESVTVTSTDTAGAWEHALDIDGSWYQRAGGPGWRRSAWIACKFFGARRATETIRIESACHLWFIGGGVVAAAPTSIAQGYHILDPQNVGAAVQVSTVDVHFVACEGVGAYFYCEGQHCTYVGGGVGPVVAVSGRVAIELGATSAGVLVACSNNSTTNAGETNSGVGNQILTTSVQVVLKPGSAVAPLLQMVTPAGANLTLSALTTATAQLKTLNNSDIDIYTNAVLRARFAKTGSFISQLNGALATTATDGFLYLPTCAGTPTGTPTAITGAVPMVFDTTGVKLWIFTGGAWKGVVVA